VSGARIVQLRSISRHYGADETLVRALDEVDVDIREGEFVAVMGPSGSGKSTAMNVIGCLDVPTSGEYLFRGVDVSQLRADELALLRRHYIGFVFQSFNLLTRTSAVENVELPLIYKGVGRAERRKAALRALANVGLADRWDAEPNKLSGGQQQRVAIARALVTEPNLLLADEPTGNLDSTTSAEIMTMLQDLHSKQGKTIIMVTHENDIARYAERVLFFVDGQLVKDGPPDEVLS
jgi:putative ABC transport system ATP-binding protein